MLFEYHILVSGKRIVIKVNGKTTVDFPLFLCFAKDFMVIPTPGHSEGHCCLLFAERFLFTGDHLYWNQVQKQLAAFRDYCWYSWDIQKDSMSRLAQFSFEWILPGHGQRVQLPSSTMAEQMVQLVDRM